jgi:hypothetical protein
MQTVSTIGFAIAMEQRAKVDVEIAMLKLALTAAQPPISLSPRRRDHHTNGPVPYDPNGVVSPKRLTHDSFLKARRHKGRQKWNG